MKNKNIKNKPKKCGRWLFLHFRFSKIFRGSPPGPTSPLPYKGNTSIKPSKTFFNNNSSQRQKTKQTKKKKPKKKQVAQRATIAHLSPMCQGQSAPKPYATFPPPQ